MFKLGCFTFGGGWSIIAQMQQEFVEKRQWMTAEQLVDFTSLSRSFPGIMVINIAVMFGYSAAGIPGAIVSAFGLSLPAIVAIGIVTFFYTTLKKNLYAEKLMNGVRSAVIPIIFSAGLKLRKASLKGRLSWALAGAGFLLCAFTGVNKILVILGGVLTGVILWRIETKKKETNKKEAKKDALS
jgi:chromate transporter